MASVYPPKFRRGDLVRVVAPALSRAMVMEHDNTTHIERRFAEMGLRLSFGEHVDEADGLLSSSVQSRVDDLHAAFSDPDVAGILTVIGGFSSNELLPYLHWDLIAANPKILCGYSDITALQNAIYAKTGLVTYSGPHWSTFGMRDHFEESHAWFVDALFGEATMDMRPVGAWTDDTWFRDQDRRTLIPSDGWWPLQAGTAIGRIVGGNLCTLNLLQGTTNMPSLEGALLFVEDDFESHPATFARDLASLLQTPGAEGIRGLVIGRFQQASRMTRELLALIVAKHPVLAGLPVLANADFGHTSPMLTFPIGGEAEVLVGESSSLRITRH
ncbi:S66 peptidase family protein [Arthrobacter sp. efr-133-TYG-118]|uniref:S66 family peptidase n=1 Tax=Arthrobacter sp. efr-133-TYG-118 TaxID=3040279 RepID=UPI0025512114|nr:S66 peptidase family protein [Arthrobacter sp. efr-133-TYG-118]